MAGSDRGDWLRGVDLNHRPLGYEPNELPDCSTPQKNHITAKGDATVSPASVLLCPVLLHFGNGGTVCRSFPHRPLVINLGFLGFGALSGLCRARPFLLDEALRPSAPASRPVRPGSFGLSLARLYRVCTMRLEADRTG